jgi:hypothetical protein
MMGKSLDNQPLGMTSTTFDDDSKIDVGEVDYEKGRCMNMAQGPCSVSGFCVSDVESLVPLRKSSLRSVHISLLRRLYKKEIYL